MTGEDAEGKGVKLPIAWQIPDDIVTRYATNIVVQHTEHEFIVSFFEVRPPMLLGLPEERRAALHKIEQVEARCVGRVVIAPERMQEFIDVLQENLQAYHETASRSSQ